MRKKWTEEELECLRYYYLDMGLSISEFYNDFKLKYPNRTMTSIKVKIKKMKLRHTKIQISELKSRLNKGEKNGMYGKIGPNKGLKKENCQRIREASKKLSSTRKKNV